MCFVFQVNTWVSKQDLADLKLVWNDMTKTVGELRNIIGKSPHVDHLVKQMQYADEFFKKYWLVTKNFPILSVRLNILLVVNLVPHFMYVIYLRIPHLLHFCIQIINWDFTKAFHERPLYFYILLFLSSRIFEIKINASLIPCFCSM